MVIEHRLVDLREQPAPPGAMFGAPLTSSLDSLEVVGADRNSVQRHKTSDAGPKRPSFTVPNIGLVALHVNVNILELADLVAVSVNQVLAMPLGEVANVCHPGRAYPFVGIPIRAFLIRVAPAKTGSCRDCCLSRGRSGGPRVRAGWPRMQIIFPGTSLSFPTLARVGTERC